MVFPALTWVLIPVAAVLCAVGFYKFSYFRSVGGGLATAGTGLAVLIIGLARGDITLALAVECLLCLIYGFRLGGFLALRELRDSAYRKRFRSQKEEAVPLPVKLLWWAGLSLLYVFQMLPLWYREAAPEAGLVPAWAGSAVMALGIALETAADIQKSKAKRIDPHSPVMSGLYRFSRCPNYFGELLFWLGLFIGSLNVYEGLQWLIAALSLAVSIFLIVRAVGRLEKRQRRNYGQRADYREYAAATPVLIPFLPLYRLTREE